MSSYGNFDNKGKDILILGEGPTQGLDDTTLTVEAKYLINFTQSGKRFLLSLHCNGSNIFFSYVLMLQNYVNSKQKTQKKKMMCCVLIISQNILQLIMWKKTGLKGVIKFFSDDFNPIDTSNILDIHKYLMERT